MKTQRFNSLIIWFFQVRALIRKELLVLMKDPVSRSILIAPVIIQAFLFGYAASFDLRYVPYAVMDSCNCKASTELLTHLDSTGMFIRAMTLTSQSQIEDAVVTGKVVAAINIPSDFAAKLSSGQTAPVELILDGRNSMTASLAGAYISSIAANYGASITGQTSAVSVDTRSWYNPTLDSRWNILIALIASLSLLQTMMMAAFSVARERERGTFDQLLVTPLTPPQILVGKAVPSIIIGIAQSTLIFLIVQFWFGIHIVGSVGLLYLGLLFFNIAAVGIGLSISALCTNMQQAMLWSFLLIVPFVLLSGFVSPIANMAVGVRYLTYLNPLRFGLEIVKRVYLEGAVLGDIWMEFIPLTLMAAVCLPIAGWLFRHKLY